MIIRVLSSLKDANDFNINCLIVSSFFKNCAHPDEKQRLEIGRRLGLESRQVKFWFQNRRTQLKVISTES